MSQYNRRDMETDVEKLKQMVGKCRVGMLGIYQDDRIHFSPMSHVDIDDQGDLWFFTSNKIRQDLKYDSSVHLVYIYEPDGTFLSIEGIAQVNNNKGKMKELFNPFIKAWFPKGLDDQSLTLLVVRPIEVEYWINESRVLTYNKIFSPNVSENNV
ncbi:MAG: pyridoxamine 5'-phosphate oxidase [Marivirga sp.]|nr:pyridoxamine 5'-phosphate oxidase [Marivirga sp.]